MIIRKINIDDAKEFLDMLKQLDRETKNMLYEENERKTTEDEMRTQIKDILESNSLILISEMDDKLVGFLSADRGFANRIKHSAYIVIGILKEYRGKKIGSRLFQEVERWAKDNSITRLELTVMKHNKGGVNLYKKMGYEIEGVKAKSLIVDGKYVDEYYMAKLI
ncbi:GNAT family N-acetyltransferase [Maledivibacter halophilus]|uniref:Protein N-acetyltransferase, RimJ/RimL family n=1 Tax=Maledivibacter halophilus TaxID=36842 RepID=A0A1T5KYC0_9FIRM|nr:GNAT family N-acetyltransferase [Maledivibacter halophilus]SKC68724.1 Protein N-acetyltransferase, RimJ/RimL family [Maledivibacter halophilus]